MDEQLDMKRFLLGFLLFLFGQISFAGDEGSRAMQFEEPLYKNTEAPFDIDLDIEPSANEFELQDYSVMSSESGNRQAMLTIYNTASGQRIVNEDHIVAILGNGHRVHPHAFKLKLSGEQTVNQTVQFGNRRYPIVKIIMH